MAPGGSHSRPLRPDGFPPRHAGVGWYVPGMEPIINLEENPGKTVGRRRAPCNPLDPGAHRKADAVAWQRAFATGGLPKGVFKFHSHEEADEWLWKMLTRNTKMG